MTTRQKFITDLIERYKKSNKDDYDQFVKQMKWRRKQLKDGKHASWNQDDNIRTAVSMPQKLHNMIEFGLKGEKRFGEEEGELVWFAKRHKEFLLPTEY